MEKVYGSSSVYRKVLGLNWDTSADDFIFDFEFICRTAEKLDVTKLDVIFCVSQLLFDATGMYKSNYTTTKAHILKTL